MTKERIEYDLAIVRECLADHTMDHAGRIYWIRRERELLTEAAALAEAEFAERMALIAGGWQELTRSQSRRRRL